MKNQRKILVIGLMLTLMSVSVFGQNYFSGMGIAQNKSYDARSEAMGLSRTAIEQGAWSVTGNPALMGHSKGFGLSVSLLTKNINETRSIPAIDQFNDVVTKNVYATNDYSHSTLAFALDYTFNQFALAYAYAPVHDISFGYSEEIRNSLSSSYYNRDPLAGYHTFEMNGQIYGHYLGASTNLKGLSLGFSIANYSAQNLSILKMVSVLSADDALAATESYSDLTSYTLDDAGFGYNVGLSYNITNHTSIHYVAEKMGDITLMSDGIIPYADSTKRYPEYLKLDTSSVYTIETPLVHRMGIAFKPGQSQKTVVNFEVEFHKAQSIIYAESVNGLDAFDYDLENYKVFHAGFEHWAAPTLPLRLGFSYEESPIDKALSITRFTVGGSLLIDHFQFDLGGSIASVGYTYPDIFPKVSMANNPRDESINERNSNLYLTVSYRLP